MLKGKYQAVLFATDGDHVTDFKDCDTKEEVWDRLNDMGSRWFFYPLHFVATDKTIVDAPDDMKALIGYSIEAVGNGIKQATHTIDEALKNDWPLHHVSINPITNKQRARLNRI